MLYMYLSHIHIMAAEETARLIQKAYYLRMNVASIIANAI